MSDHRRRRRRGRRVASLYLFKALGWQATAVDPVRPKHWPAHEEALRNTIEGWTEHPYSLDHLHARLQKESFDAVIDLAPTFDKRKSVTLCDEAGVSLINSTMVDWREGIHIAAYNFLDNRPQAARRPHIVASGMNPGALNAMAEDIIRQTGQPDAIVYWEYDDTMPACGKYRGPSITWCPSESTAEIVEDWNFEVLEEGTVLLHEDAMDWPLQGLGKCGVPMDLVPVPQGTEGFLIGHEECVCMGWRHDTAVKFVYGFHPENMRLIRAAGYDVEPELLLRRPGWLPPPWSSPTPMEILDGRIEVYEYIYELAGQRISDYRHFRREYAVEIIIAVILGIEALLVAYEVYLYFQE